MDNALSPRFILLNIGLAAAAIAALYLPTFALSEEYKPLQGEMAPKVEVKCEWSKLSAADYSQCLKRKEYYQKQSPKEAREQNRDATKDRLENGIKAGEDGGWRRAAHRGKR
jgi:flagellar biosynthesis/type III secretory pathway protein FliH